MRIRSVLIGCASLLALSNMAMAQDAGSSNQGSDRAGAIETVVVTAAKTGRTTLVSTPMSIQVLTSADLKAKHITDIHDLITTAVPGASEEEQIGNFVRDYAMRGSGAGGGIGDPMIGYYIDDTAWSIPNSQVAPALRMVDIDRVEVLRGPYGTLYGQGAMGGIMIFHTRDPNLDHFTADGDGTLASMQDASDPNYSVEGAISIPIVQGKLALRLSGGYDYQAGYASVYSGAAVGTPLARHANDVKQDDFRAVLLWQPSGKFSGRFTYWRFGGYQHYSTQLQSVRPAYLSNWGNIKGFEYSRSSLYSATLKYDLGWAALTSASSYIRTGGENNYALFPTVALDQGGNTHGNRYPFTYNAQEELRLTSTSGGPFHWVGGMFYQDARSTYWYSIPAFNIGATTTINTRNWSTYGEASYDLFGGKLVPLVGIRYFSDNRSFVSTNNPGTPTASTVNGSAAPRVWTWRANLSYHPSDNMTVYFNAGTGFRSPIMQSAYQVAALHTDGINGQLTLKPDSDISYELGIKGLLSDANLEYAASVYWLTYHNFQTGVNTTSSVAAFANLGTAKTEGIDLELHWYPIDGLSLGFTGNINRSRYGAIDPSVAADSGGALVVHPGALLLNTPRFSARFDIGYERDIGNGYTLYTNEAIIPMSKRINQYGVYSSPYTLYNAAVGVRFGKYDLELFGENLGDARGPYYIRVLTSPKDMIVGPNPRTIGIRGSLHFD